MKFFLKKYLSKADIGLITTKIAEVERSTSGEIRVSILHRRGWGERKLSLYDLALKEFARLGMNKTSDRTGVLIMFVMSERAFQIIADEGIHAKVPDGTWEKIAAEMSGHFRLGKYVYGICDAVEAVGRELRQHFPRGAHDRDELSNDVVER